MKKLLLTLALLIFVLSACSHTAYIRKNPDFLKPGLRASAFLEVWGQPDETFAYQDYENKQYSQSSMFWGGWNSTGSGSVRGYGQGRTYTPTTEVWIYKKQNKILFFEKQPYVRRLVGWGNLPEPPKSKEEPKSSEYPEKKYIPEISYADGGKYVGDILDGKRHGQGTYIWPNGDKYVGEFQNNNATGGWFYKTTGQKVWVYQDSEGKWIVKEQ